MSVTREDIAYAKEQVRYARQVLRERQERLNALRVALVAQESLTEAAEPENEAPWVPTHRSLRDGSEVRCVGISKSEMTLVLQNENGDEWQDSASEWEALSEPENVACVVCGRTDLPLHTDHQCPECHVLPVAGFLHAVGPSLGWVDEDEGFDLDHGFGGDR